MTTSLTVLNFSVIILAVCANIIANVSLKVAMSSGSGSSLREHLFELPWQLSFWVGILAAMVLLGSYLVALRSFPASFAYVAVTSLAMVGLVFADRLFFGVPLSIYKIAGVGLVITGVCLLTFKASA